MGTHNGSCYLGGDHGPPGQGQDPSPPLRIPRKNGRQLSFALLVLALLMSAGLAGASPVRRDHRAQAAPPLTEMQEALEPDVTLPTSYMQIDVNYSQDWVRGVTDPDSSVHVTVRDAEGAVKDEAQLELDEDGFVVDCSDWYSGECSDIAPGDSIEVTNQTTGEIAIIDPIGAWRMAELSAADNTVSAELHADWLSDPVQAYCEVWPEFGDGPAPIGQLVDPDGGTLLCDFGGVAWDLEPSDTVMLLYVEPDGDRVYANPPWPWRRVNIAEDWVGAALAAGHTEQVSVLDSGLALKASANMSAGFSTDWGGEGYDTRPSDWVPDLPDIVPGDVIVFDTGAFTSEVKVGMITGTVDAETDKVSGSILVPGEVGYFPIECHPWGAWEAGIGDAPVVSSTAGADGSPGYTCSWDPATEYDVQPGQRIAVMYIEPDADRVIDVFSEPAAYLRLRAESASVPAPGGNVRLHLEVGNYGDADAESVTLEAQQDPAAGLLYLRDTSSLPLIIEPGKVTWDVGTLTPGTTTSFDVFFETNVASGTVLTSTVIAETTSYTSGEAWERMYAQLWYVQPNDAQLAIGKWATVARPAAGQELEYGVWICNNGATSSGTITVTDTPGPGQEITNWWGDEPGWKPAEFRPEPWAGEHPVVDPGACLTVHTVAMLGADLPILSPVTNTATLESVSDLTPDDNEGYWEGVVGAPWVNLTVTKSLSGGRLVPGGMLRYDIVVRNEGNIPSGPLTVTDTFPASTAFDSSWTSSSWGSTDLPPSSLTGTHAIWEVPALGPGQQLDMGLALQIASDAVTGIALINNVAVSSDAPEVRYDDNLSQTAHLLYALGPNLSVVKRAAWLDGEHIGYDVFFDNLGSTIISNVIVTDTLPAGTTVPGEIRTDLEDERILALEVVTGTVSTIALEVDQLFPGERHWMGFVAALEDAEGIDSFLNTVEITLPASDVQPADNAFGTQVDRPRPLDWVEVFVNDSSSSAISGGSPPGTDITVTTPLGSFFSWADPSCGGCWAVEDLGLLEPGDLLSVQAGTGAPLQLAVPDPFTAVADSQTDEVYGEARLIAYGLTDIYGDWGSNGMTWTDSDGTFGVALDNVPPGATGTVHIRDNDHTVPVFWARPFSTLDLLLEVNYGHDWINAPYEAGHDGIFTVTEGDGSTVKAAAALWSQVVSEWGGWTGFTTLIEDLWVPVHPDIVPGDWVYGEVDNGRRAEVQLGEIGGVLDIVADSVSGTITLPGPWETEGWCAVWVDGGPEMWFSLPAGGGGYTCDLGAAGWDLRAGQDIAVGYIDPAGHRVMTVFREEGYTVFLPLVMR